ncbi:MAG: L-aspartate oxidase [Planctomycetes bacterium]|nr:L-aspartate oxidase [Planctomycetota bacterium]
MATLFDTRRYLTDFDSRRTAHILTDVLVIGSGVAGARAAIEAAPHGGVTLMCKGDFDDSTTRLAQGGIAAAIGDPSAIRLHYDDTIRVGCGLSREKAVRILVQDGPARVAELLDWGMELDRVDGELARTREGGHSVSRVLHAHGDQTGRELVRILKRRVFETPGLRVFDRCFLLDLISIDGVCFGAVAFHERYGHQLIWAKRTILACGGCGQVWRETTNPPGSTGDGLAAAWRAGATLCGMELMQFHPTTLYVAGAGRTLISEAVRGEGAYLVDRDGERFMQSAHADAELAPRDVVSRVIQTHLTQTRSNAVYLDVRHIAGFTKRFPGVSKLCAEFGIDVTRDLIPVRPSAHYMIGGVDVGLDGTTSLEGLFACGEVAYTGVHGANRLASNSLLEGLVFGQRVGLAAGEQAARVERPPPVVTVVSVNPPSDRTSLDLVDIRNSLASVMWRNVGIVRNAERLRETCDILDFWGHYTLDKTFDDVAGWETQNKLTIARVIAASARERTESIGVHWRTDGEPSGKPYDVLMTRDPGGSRPVRRVWQ